jgi:hypothetical protein
MFEMVRKFFYDTEFMEEPGFLQLISIGVVDESGENEFYCCNLDADLDRANDWVKENVIPQLPRGAFFDRKWEHENLLKEKLLKFLNPSEKDPVELWGYYSSFDYVILCWLFGRMVDLPSGMPMITFDIRQLCHHLGNVILPPQEKGEHDALEDARWNRKSFLWLKEASELNERRTGKILF